MASGNRLIGIGTNDAGRDRRVVERVARLERVRAVQDHVIAGDQPVDVLLGHPAQFGLVDAHGRVILVGAVPSRLDQ